MKKKRRLIVIPTVVVVLAAIIYGSLTWNERMQQSGVQATQTLEEQGINIRTVDTSIFDKKDEDVSISPEADKQPQESVPSEPQVKNTQGEETEPEQPGKSLMEIKQAYTLEFLELEAEINKLLDDILARALLEYAEARESNGTIKTADLQSKYVIEILDLESYSDSQFNDRYRQFESELSANGYSKNEATPYRAKYNAEKQNRERKALEDFRALR